jgi:carotenoid cleavage dioxygenase-like enzyme
MVQPFPDHPFLKGFYAPFGAEIDAPDLVVVGDLPADLNGTFYRNGPDPLYPPRDVYHPFDGDGMIYAFHFSNGKISMRNRWVRTKKFEQELAAGRKLFGVFGNPMTSDPSVNFMDYNTANTHIWPHAGRIFALMEGCPPVELDPVTLETRGSETFQGAVTGPFTAHPKYDLRTGNLYAFGYSAKGPGSKALRYTVIDPQAKAARLAWIEQPYASMMHDFVVTENLVMFPCMPVVIDLSRAMQGKPLAAWEPNCTSSFGIMSRDGDGSDLKWIETDPTFTFHFANGFEHNGAVVCDAVVSPRAPLMPDTQGRFPSHEDTRFRLTRWTIGDEFSVSEWDDMDLQFPRIDDRWMGRPYRYVFANGSTSPIAGREEGFNAVVRYDLTTGQRATYVAGAGAYAGEPVFVPSGPDEGQGHLLCLVWHKAENRSDLIVLDAQNLSSGPVATVKLPTRVPAGFHCHWRPD